MAKVDSRWRQWAPLLLSILRIITGFLFMQHGAQKLFGLLGGSRGGQPQFPDGGGPWSLDYFWRHVRA